MKALKMICSSSLLSMRKRCLFTKERALQKGQLSFFAEEDIG